MGADTGLHADEAGREVGKPGFELAAGELLAQNDGAALVEADAVEGALTHVDAEDGDGVFRVARHGRTPCLGAPPARRWVLRGAPPVHPISGCDADMQRCVPPLPRAGRQVEVDPARPIRDDEEMRIRD